MSQSSQANRSTESGMSSLQRSGLNISVGDTKSIVLALQALQQKIRALERDRDYHQEQYERSLQANEAYKLEMESQMEQERAAYRKREEALRAQLQRTLDEKRHLETSTDNDDLMQFRSELETMIAEEKRHAQQREGKLADEIERLRAEVEQERRTHRQLLESSQKIRAEREEACRTNEQLRHALNELISREEQLRASPPRHIKSTTKGNRPATKRSHSSVRDRDRSARRPSYRDPTVNSILRDIRNVSAESPCTHDEASFSTTPVPRRSSPASRNTSALRTRPLDDYTPPKKSAQLAPQSVGYDDSVKEVEQQIHEELMDLQAQYRSTVARAANENLPETVVTTALSRITSLIENKKKQLELLRGSYPSQSASRSGKSGG
ncbi:hypothetical protein AGDE_00922 [Angomonas deanei]|nr:hypothetical protein AGDE_00922 [Angomonas deanei]|eukprot:EPY43001.1 hypothetical protein AGDE_00922 [Angomonas deanei]